MSDYIDQIQKVKDQEQDKTNQQLAKDAARVSSQSNMTAPPSPVLNDAKQQSNAQLQAGDNDAKRLKAVQQAQAQQPPAQMSPTQPIINPPSPQVNAASGQNVTPQTVNPQAPPPQNASNIDPSLDTPGKNIYELPGLTQRQVNQIDATYKQKKFLLNQELTAANNGTPGTRPVQAIKKDLANAYEQYQYAMGGAQNETSTRWQSTANTGQNTTPFISRFSNPGPSVAPTGGNNMQNNDSKITKKDTGPDDAKKASKTVADIVAKNPNVGNDVLKFIIGLGDAYAKGKSFYAGNYDYKTISEKDLDKLREVQGNLQYQEGMVPVNKANVENAENAKVNPEIAIKQGITPYDLQLLQQQGRNAVNTAATAGQYGVLGSAVGALPAAAMDIGDKYTGALMGGGGSEKKPSKLEQKGLLNKSEQNRKAMIQSAANTIFGGGNGAMTPAKVKE
jgi:hypothetical protein